VPNVAGVHALIETQAEASGEIVVVKLTGSADPASMHALIAELQALAHLRGKLRILVDETELHAWRNAPDLRSSRIAVIAANPIVRGLNQVFRLLANLERKDSLNAFSERADAVAWLVAEVAAAP
jgi:hypothetical protein